VWQRGLGMHTLHRMVPAPHREQASEAQPACSSHPHPPAAMPCVNAAEMCACGQRMAGT